MRLRALCVAVLAAALALAHANLNANLRALGELQACASDADCRDARVPVCLTNGECGGLRSRLACSGDQPCGPNDEKRCRRNAHCEGNALCNRDADLGYRTCKCPKNQEIVNLDEQSFCEGADENSNEDDEDEEEEGPVMTPGARMGCGCPAGTFRESNGRCVPACCTAPMRAQPGNACPEVCGQTIDCDADVLMQTWDGGKIMGARCNCPRYRPVFDPVRNECIPHQGLCDARNAATECPGALTFMLKQPCPQVCGQPEITCSADAPSRPGCGCPDPSKPVFDPKTGACVGDRDQCDGDEEPPPPPPEPCQFPLVFFENKPCQQVCGREPQSCATVVQPGCACPLDTPKFDPETEGCVAACPGEEECEGGRVWYPVQKACEQECGKEPIFCAALLEPGCACEEGKLWSEGAQRCVLPTECDARRV